MPRITWRKLHCIAVSLVLSQLSFVQGARADSVYPIANVSLKDLSFMVGRWREQREGTTLEEHWSDVLVNNMIGMCRFCDSSGLKLVEMMTLEQEGHGPVLRMRHFNGDLVPWTSEKTAMTCTLTKWIKDEAMFESREDDKLVRITYRTSAPDTLTAIVEKVTASESSSTEFHYTRIK